MTSIPIVSNIWTIEAQTSRLSCFLGFRSHAKISEPNVDERAMAEFPRSVRVGTMDRRVEAVCRHEGTERAIRGLHWDVTLVVQVKKLASCFSHLIARKDERKIS